jgi:hypothetical protein
MDLLLVDELRPAASPALADSEDERGAMGENRCHPPPLAPPSRAPPTDRSLDDLSFDDPFPDDRPFAAPVAPLLAEKKCWFCDTLRVVEAAAGRPLADMLSRLGLTDSLPVLKRAFCIWSWVIACAFMWALPNSLPETEVAPRKFRSCMARFTFENREPARSGAKPPRLNPP